MKRRGSMWERCCERKRGGSLRGAMRTFLRVPTFFYPFFWKAFSWKCLQWQNIIINKWIYIHTYGVNYGSVFPGKVNDIFKKKEKKVEQSEPRSPYLMCTATFRTSTTYVDEGSTATNTQRVCVRTLHYSNPISFIWLPLCGLAV